MKTRREILVGAGIPSSELEIIRTHTLDIAPSSSELNTPGVLHLAFTWADTPQGARYWREWHHYLKVGGLKPASSAPGAEAHADLRDRMAVAALQAIIVQGQDPAGAYAAADRALAFRDVNHE